LPAAELVWGLICFDLLNLWGLDRLGVAFFQLFCRGFDKLSNFAFGKIGAYDQPLGFRALKPSMKIKWIILP
jgi:hypothetical protein